MKKIVLSLAAVVAVLTLASCDQKVCYCYQSTSSGVYEEEVMTNSDTPCNALGSATRGCIESHERGTMNQGGIAYAPGR